MRVGLGAREGPRGGGRRLRFGRPREELEAQAPRVAGKILQKADVAEVKRHDEDRVPRQRGVRRRTRRPPSCCLPTLGSDVDALGPRKRPRQRRGIFALHILDREASTADGSRHDQQQKDSHAGAISRSRFRLALEPTRKGPVARERVRPAWWTSVARRRGRFPGREALFDRGRSLRFGMLSSAAPRASGYSQTIKDDHRPRVGRRRRRRCTPRPLKHFCLSFCLTSRNAAFSPPFDRPCPKVTTCKRAWRAERAFEAKGPLVKQPSATVSA